MAEYKMALTLNLIQKLDNLQYEIAAVGGGASPYRADGIFAGCYHFEQGDTLATEVTLSAVGAPENTKYSINRVYTDLVCLTAARSNPDKDDVNDGLSPYCGHKATCGMENAASTEIAAGEAITMMADPANPALKVVSTGGSWKLSGCVSVDFTVTPADGSKPVKMQRVYSFDPEVIVGTGKRTGDG